MSFEKELTFYPLEINVKRYQETKSVSSKDESGHSQNDLEICTISCEDQRGETYQLVQGEEEVGIFIIKLQNGKKEVRYYASRIAVLIEVEPLRYYASRLFNLKPKK